VSRRLFSTEHLSVAVGAPSRLFLKICHVGLLLNEDKKATRREARLDEGKSYFIKSQQKVLTVFTIKS
jgi:hypothetical protein